MTYLSPTTETLVVRFEGCLCVSDPSKVYRSGTAGYYDSENDDINDNGSY